MSDRNDFAPVTDEDWPDTIAGMRDGFAGRLNVYRSMAHHPDLLRAWAPLREHIVRNSALPPQFSEVAILRAGLRLGSSYELNQHVDRARNRGLDDRRIATILGPREWMAADDRLIAQAVDELFDATALTAPTLAALTDKIGKAGVLDLIATVGFYSTLGYMLNSFETPLDTDIAVRLSERPFDPDLDEWTQAEE